MIAPLKGRCFLHSVHASLAFDYQQILQALGMTITTGNMDRSYEERPYIEGYSGFDFGEEVRARVNTLACIPEDFKDCDFIWMMNPADFHWRVAHFSKFKPVVMYVNGQWVDLQMDELAGTINGQWDRKEQCNIWVAVYSKVEERYLRARIHTQLQERIHHIRFAKKFSDYAPWIELGEKAPVRGNFGYTTCNDIHRRGESCNWAELQQVVKGFPHILSGRNTQEVGGQGLVAFDKMREYMRTCSVYAGVPCWPAPIVLNMVEALMCGAPVAYYDNKRGVAEEGIFDGGVGCCSHDIPGLRSFLRRCLSEPSFREDQSALSLQRANEFFNFDKQVEKWRVLFEQMSTLWK